MFGSENDLWFDRNFLLTSATEGLGPELARALVARGGIVLAVDTNAAALRHLAAEIGGGVVTLTRDLSEPAAPIELARWIADEHRNFGGLICNATGAACTPGPGIAARILAPLSVLGLLGTVLPDTGAALTGVAVPDAPVTRGIARLTTRLRDARWNAGGRGAFTSALVAPGMSAAGQDARYGAANRILDAVARRAAILRITPPKDGRTRAAFHCPVAAPRGT